MPDEIPSFEAELKIPPRAEFVGVARLSIARVASLMPFTFDDVEDIRLAIGEACTRAIERLQTPAPGQQIRLPCTGYEDRLVIEVHSPLGAATEGGSPGSDEDLGAMLVQILMDELTEEARSEQGEHVLRMVKYVNR